MSGDIKRVELPSGGWWDLRKPTKWSDHVKWTEILLNRTGDNDPRLSDKILIAFTEAWSFEAEPSIEAMDDLDIDDVIAAYEAYDEHVAPFLASRRAANSKRKTSS